MLFPIVGVGLLVWAVMVTLKLTCLRRVITHCRPTPSRPRRPIFPLVFGLFELLLIAIDLWLGSTTVTIGSDTVRRRHGR
ncbi:MAG TPA: hypothetical protein VI485_25815 [Vicinamibacterales bacterium]|nr:hypothetical protein [Vicinamibacterales bacterium]